MISTARIASATQISPPYSPGGDSVHSIKHMIYLTHASLPAPSNAILIKLGSVKFDIG